MHNHIQNKRKNDQEKEELIQFNLIQSNPDIMKSKAIESDEGSQSDIYSYHTKSCCQSYSLFQSDLGNILRVGLCIEEGSKTIVKRGWPKAYEYTETESEKAEFTKTLRVFLDELFIQRKIASVNIDYVNILSENYITISYIQKISAWIISLKGNQTVIVKTIEELDDLNRNGKINSIVYDICTEWLNIALNHLFSDDLKQKCSSVTLVGYYISDVDDIIYYCKKGIVFASLVYNIKHTVKYSRTPKYSEDFFLKFGLSYMKYERVSSGIISSKQFMDEVSRIYKTISQGYLRDQMKGKMITISNDKRIISSFKMINNEWKIMSAIKKGVINGNEMIYSQLKQELLSKYALPFDAEVYSALWSYLVINKKNDPTQKAYTASNAHLFLTKKGHPGISPDLSKTNNIYLASVAIKNTSPSKLNLQHDYYKMLLSTEKDSLSARMNNYNALNIIPDLHSISKKKIESKTSRSNNSQTIDLIDNGTSLSNIKQSHSQRIDTSKPMQITRTNDNKLSSKSKHKVNFIDEISKTPISSITFIESYKRFNVGYKEDSDDESSILSSDSTCCIIL